MIVWESYKKENTKKSNAVHLDGAFLRLNLRGWLNAITKRTPGKVERQRP